MSKFQTYFTKPYETIETTLKDHITNGQTILDIGCNEGTIAEIVEKYHKDCFVHCLDINKEALDKLRDKRFKRNRIYERDANDFLDNTDLRGLDNVVINATLHEINDVENQEEYLRNFFSNCKRILKQKGKLIIGDYYYTEKATDQEVEDYMKQQIKEINHADPRYKFVHPELIRKVAEESRFQIIQELEIQAVKGIDRKYYNFVLVKK